MAKSRGRKLLDQLGQVEQSADNKKIIALIKSWSTDDIAAMRRTLAFCSKQTWGFGITGTPWVTICLNTGTEAEAEQIHQELGQIHGVSVRVDSIEAEMSHRATMKKIADAQRRAMAKELEHPTIFN